MLSTKNLPESKGFSKTIQPGNRVARINSISCEANPFQPEKLRIILQLETDELGEGFDGFFIDKDRPELGKYKGQIGKVRLSQWDYADGEYNGEPIYRDDTMLKALKNLARALGKEAELNEIEAKTIEQFVEKASPILSGPESFLSWCIAGREYMNKEGYPAYDLFIPKAEKRQYPYEALEVEISKLLKFDQTKHIVKPKPAATVNNFKAGGAIAQASAKVTGNGGFAAKGASNDLDLD
jgi:hypothetical protein